MERTPIDQFAHDVRSPLSAILGFSELLRDGKVGPVSPEQRECLTHIADSARAIARAVEALEERPPAH